MMKTKFYVMATLAMLVGMTSCVSKKKFVNLQSELEVCNTELGKCGEDLSRYINLYEACVNDKKRVEGELRTLKSNTDLRQEQIDDLKAQIADLRKQRDKQIKQIGDLTDLSQSASDNIGQTLAQLQDKERHLNLLRNAKSKTDSINLALAVNLKGVLKDGIDDNDIEVKVDKMVVFVNLSDKMAFQSGSSRITPQAELILGKIATILESRPDLEVMVEGYTDNRSIKTSCIDDNWDLSVKRATSVVRVLQDRYKVDPNRLIAAGRGEYNTLVSNDTEEGRAMNRRTRIIILPKVDQFYDLLDPDKAPPKRN
jgi:chemotaxis protein MotB